MSVDIERYSSSALVRFSLGRDNDWILFSKINVFETPCLTISEAGSDFTFKLLCRKLSSNIIDFGIWIFFSTRISESSLLINPFEIVPHLGEI